MSFFLALALILFFYMTGWFIVSIWKKRNDVADVAWGLGFVLLSWGSLWIASSLNIRSLGVVFLVSIWGLRLAWHIALRHRGTDEDYRYATWRKTWRFFYLRSFFQIYLLQGILLFSVLTPVLFIVYSPGGALNIIDFLGLMVWIAGFTFEAIGDAQLKNFLKQPENRGKLMQSGLWYYTRHPNYFGEVSQWWGIFIIALNVPYGYVSIIGPLTITFLILKVSGIPLLEEKMSTHPDFAEYSRKTSMFFPWFPRK